MNHYRQQAVGNILSMVYRGSKVYLNKKNTVYHFLINVGIIVFNIEEDINRKDFFTPLDKETQIKNKEIIYSIINDENILKHLKEFYKNQ